MQTKTLPESQNHRDWRESKSWRPFFRSLLEDLPCDTLLPFEEDASQTAARILREATEKA